MTTQSVLMYLNILQNYTKNTSFNDMLNSKYYELNNIINFCNFFYKTYCKSEQISQ